jgi:ubiquinone/menaquinone biosynthesis C-methylase UbiE
MLNGGLLEVWALAEQLELSRGSIVLELGCGIGGPARHIAERFLCRVVGVDVVERQLTIARDLTNGLEVSPLLTYLRADARFLPYKELSFSHVYANEAFVHFADKPRVLREAYRVLHRGGMLAIQDPVGAPIEIGFLEESLSPWPTAAYQDELARAGFVDIAVLDRTAASRHAYGLLRELVTKGPIAPWTALKIFHELHGFSPTWWRTLPPGRLAQTAIFVIDRHRAALEVLDHAWRVDGIRRMCDDIVSAYDRGALRFCLFRARKP